MLIMKYSSNLKKNKDFLRKMQQGIVFYHY